MPSQPPPSKHPGRQHQRQLDKQERERIPRSANDAPLEQERRQADSLDGIGLRAAAKVEQDRVRDEGVSVPDQERREQHSDGSTGESGGFEKGSTINALRNRVRREHRDR